MEIIIESPHFTVNTLLQEYILRKVDKLAHYNERAIKSEVTLKLDKSDTEENKVCEIKVTAPRKNLFASSKCSTFEDAITETIHALEKQMRKQKTKYGKDSKKLYISDASDEETDQD